MTLSIANLIEMSADVRIEKHTTVDMQTQLLIGAENISAFLGVDAGTPDAIGLTFTDGTLGAVLTTGGPAGTRGGVAIRGSGTVGLTGAGLENIGLTGTVSMEVNTTGGTVDQMVSQQTQPATAVVFTDATTVSRISPPTDFDITLDEQTFVTGLFEDLAGEIDALNEDLQVTTNSAGNRIANSPLVELIPGTDLSIDDLLGAEKLTGAGKYINYYLAYLNYLSDLDKHQDGILTGPLPQAPANPDNLPNPITPPRPMPNNLTHRLNRASGTNGNLADGATTFTSTGATFTNTLANKYLAFLDDSGNIGSTFQIVTVTDGATLELSPAATESFANRSFVIRDQVPVYTVTEPTLRGLLAYLNLSWIPTISANPADGIELTLTSRGVGLGVALLDDTDQVHQAELRRCVQRIRTEVHHRCHR